MQIEQVIGGVNGDTTAQAVQLRMRSAGQNFVGSARLVAVDSAGAHPVLLKDITTSVPNGQAGRRILLSTPNFANYTNIPLVTNFEMDPIPASYLAAGQLRFMDDFGTIFWSLSWGGASYTGSTTGSTTNDVDGNFGPPVNVPLPSASLQALQFTGAANASSTNNLAQYAVTAGAATFINNAGMSFVVIAPPPTGLLGDFNDDDVVDAADYVLWRAHFGTDFDLNGNGDDEDASAGVVDQADYDLWRAKFGETAPGGGSLAGMLIPEPTSLVLALLTTVTLAMRQKRCVRLSLPRSLPSKSPLPLHPVEA